MFSRYKKPGNAKPAAGATPSCTPCPIPNAAPAAKPAGAQPARPPRRPRPRCRRDRSPASATRPAPPPNPNRWTARRKRRQRLGEIKVELHKQLLDNLNLSALDTRLGKGPARRDQHDRLGSPDRDERGAEPRRKDHPQPGTVRRGHRPRAARTAAEGRHGQRYSRQRPAPDLRRTLGQAVADRCPVQGRAPPAPDHRQDRLGGGPPGRRKQPACRRPPRGRLAFQRDGAADRGRRLAGLDPEIQEGQARHRRTGQLRGLLRRDGGLSAGRGLVPAQRHRLGRYRLGQDHLAQRAVVASSTIPNASSPSRTRRNFSSSRSTSAGWKAARPTSRARARSPSATV